MAGMTDDGEPWLLLITFTLLLNLLHALTNEINKYILEGRFVFLQVEDANIGRGQGIDHTSQCLFLIQDEVERFKAILGSMSYVANTR
jgi:hypothetical protein